MRLDKTKSDFVFKKSRKVYEHNCRNCLIVFYSFNKEQTYCSVECTNELKFNIRKPNKEDLAKLLWEIPTVEIAKMFDVSDKAVEKWAKKFNLSKPGRGYWSIKSMRD